MNYYIKRLGQAVFTFWATITGTFFLVKWMPGGPMDYIMINLLGVGGAGSTGSMNTLDPEQIERYRELAKLYVNFDPQNPVYIQYLNYVSSLLQGDFGQSFTHSQPVWEVIGPAIPWTVFIGIVGIFVSFVTRVIVGGILAYKEGSRFDFAGSSALVWGHAIPFYVIALLLLFYFAFNQQWFPIGGRMNQQVEPGLTYPFVAGILHHAALPIIATAWATFGAGALGMRANSIQILGTDYVRVGRLRGLSTRRIAIRYVARNAILPMYTGLLIGIGYIFGGSIITETIFNYRGVGFYMFRAIQGRDTTLLMAGFILITTSVVVALFVADLTYSMLDPRVTDESEEAY